MSDEASEQKSTFTVEEDPTYFELHAYTGATKHMGGLRTTKEFIELRGVSEGRYVLEVGCSVGAPACFLGSFKVMFPSSGTVPSVTSSFERTVPLR